MSPYGRLDSYYGVVRRPSNPPVLLGFGDATQESLDPMVRLQDMTGGTIARWPITTTVIVLGVVFYILSDPPLWLKGWINSWWTTMPSNKSWEFSTGGHGND